MDAWTLETRHYNFNKYILCNHVRRMVSIKAERIKFEGNVVFYRHSATRITAGTPVSELLLFCNGRKPCRVFGHERIGFSEKFTFNRGPRKHFERTVRDAFAISDRCRSTVFRLSESSEWIARRLWSNTREKFERSASIFTSTKRHVTWICKSITPSACIVYHSI